MTDWILILNNIQFYSRLCDHFYYYGIIFHWFLGSRWYLLEMVLYVLSLFLLSRFSRSISLLHFASCLLILFLVHFFGSWQGSRTMSGGATCGRSVLELFSGICSCEFEWVASTGWITSASYDLCCLACLLTNNRHLEFWHW